MAISAGCASELVPASWRCNVAEVNRSSVRTEATAWLKSLRADVSVAALRTAALAAIAQAGHDPDSAHARIGRDGHADFNKLREPSGVQLSEDEFTLLYGPVLAWLFLDSGPATDSFFHAVVTQWHTTLQHTGALQRCR